jgi:hypothetical protein
MIKLIIYMLKFYCFNMNSCHQYFLKNYECLWNKWIWYCYKKKIRDFTEAVMLLDIYLEFLNSLNSSLIFQ